LTGVSAIFFRKNVIAPYFNPNLRWWETEQRFKLDLYCEVEDNGEKIKGDIIDISEIGSFITPSKALTVGSKYKVTVYWVKNSIDFEVKVIRASSPKEKYNGYGIMFIHITEEQKVFISNMIRELKNAGLDDSLRLDFEKNAPENTEEISRFKTKNRIIFLNEQIHGTIVDFSKNGAFIISNKKLSVGNTFEIEIDCLTYSFNTLGKVIRENTISNDEYGYGILFESLDSTQKKLISGIIKDLKNAGFQHRPWDPSNAPNEVIEKSVENTPYKIVKFFKKLFGKK